jgi:hypothetical protein
VRRSEDLPPQTGDLGRAVGGHRCATRRLNLAGRDRYRLVHARAADDCPFHDLWTMQRSKGALRVLSRRAHHDIILPAPIRQRRDNAGLATVAAMRNVVVHEGVNKARKRDIEPVQAPASPYLAACRLRRTSCIHDCLKVCLALRATAATLELGSLLDRKRHMMDVAVNLR